MVLECLCRLGLNSKHLHAHSHVQGPACSIPSCPAPVHQLRHHRCHDTDGTAPPFRTFQEEFLTIVQTIFGIVSSSDYVISNALVRATWVFLHLLQFCVSNQTVDPTEDVENKPWRPIPSGRISLASARRVRWMLFAVCLAHSARSATLLCAGVALSAATIVHNELKLGGHWILRNVLNAVGYATFCIGATNAGCPCTSSRHTPRFSAI